MSRAKKPKPYTVKDYLAEEMIVGGLPTTRGQFIAEMRAAGHPERCIDMYLFGYERGQTARAAAAARQIKEETI